MTTRQYCSSDLEVLMSTMGCLGNEKELLERANMTCKSIVINQCDIPRETTYYYNKYSSFWVYTWATGLSRSRNEALRYATEPISLLADDDMYYFDGFADRIARAFNENPDADLIAFKVGGKWRQKKKFWKGVKRIRWIEALKLSSVQIALKTEAIRGNGISFNESIGAGTRYPGGAENVFLWECLRAGLVIKYVPVCIGQLLPSESSWFRGYDDNYLFAKGASFAAMSKLFSVPLIVQFAIRKRQFWNDELSIYGALRYMLRGRCEYLRQHKPGDG